VEKADSSKGYQDPKKKIGGNPAFFWRLLSEVKFGKKIGHLFFCFKAVLDLKHSPFCIRSTVLDRTLIMMKKNGNSCIRFVLFLRQISYKYSVLTCCFNIFCNIIFFLPEGTGPEKKHTTKIQNESYYPKYKINLNESIEFEIGSKS